MERRAKLRAGIALDLQLTAPSLQYAVLSQTIDVSTGDAYIRSSRPLPPGTRVTVQFDRGQQWNPLSIEAEVVRIGDDDQGRPRGFAVRFVDLSDLDELVLRSLIDRAKNQSS